MDLEGTYNESDVLRGRLLQTSSKRRDGLGRLFAKLFGADGEDDGPGRSFMPCLPVPVTGFHATGLG